MYSLVPDMHHALGVQLMCCQEIGPSGTLQMYQLSTVLFALLQTAGLCSIYVHRTEVMQQLLCSPHALLFVLN